MTGLIVVIWMAVTAVIVMVGFCLVGVFVYGGALWRSLKRERKEVCEPMCFRWDREFVEREEIAAASKRRQEEMDAVRPLSIAESLKGFLTTKAKD